MAKTKSGNSGNHRPVGIQNPATRVGWKMVGDVRLLAKEWTFEAIETLAEVMKDKTSPPASRVAAAQSLLDRGWGKSAQIIEANVNHYDRMSDDELIKIVQGTVIEVGPNSGRVELEDQSEDLPE